MAMVLQVGRASDNDAYTTDRINAIFRKARSGKSLPRNGPWLA